MRRSKCIAEKQIMLGGTRVTVQVIAPKETKQAPEYMASRDDSRTPYQQFVRQSKSTFYR